MIDPKRQYGFLRLRHPLVKIYDLLRISTNYLQKWDRGLGVVS